MMIAGLALTLAVQAASGTAADYFPLDAGDTWVYSSDKDGAISEITYTADKPVKVRGKTTATPLLVNQSGTSTTLYYLDEPDTVWLLGNDKDNPYLQPRAVLRMSGKWKGDYLDRDPVNVDYEAKGLGTREVLGQRREVLEVTARIVYGNTEHKLVIIQHADYAKGVGLVRFEMEQTVDRNKQHMLMTLKSFESAAKSNP